MFKNYLKITIRNFLKYKIYSFINISGLAIGMACCLLIMLWVQDELSFDKFHANAGSIYRVVVMDRDNPARGVARVGAPWGPALQREYAEVSNFVRFRFTGRSLVASGDKRFYESEGLHADATIFQVFTFPLITGDPLTALREPNSIVINEDLAEKYFGRTDPIGQTLTFDNEVERKVTGVFKNVPHNSHMHFEFLLPFSSYQRWDVDKWDVNNFHLYLLIQKHSQATELEAKLPEFVRSHISDERADEALVKLQPLTDIHLYSNLHREFEANGDITYVYLFAIVAFFILAIACINFVNLTTARSASRAREVAIRKVVGSRRQQLIGQFLGESVFLSVIALILAVVLSETLLPYFSELSGKSVGLELSSKLFFLPVFAGITLVVGVVAGAYPAFILSGFRPVAALQGGDRTGSRRALLRKTLVITQFTISIFLIIGTAVAYDQFNFLSNTKLGFENEQVAVIRINNSAVKEKYQAFKHELMQNPNILDVSATANLLGGSDWGMPVFVESADGEKKFHTRILIVDHDFVETMQMDMAQGRDFSTEFANDRDNAILINEAAARQLGWKQPIGKTIRRMEGEDEAGNTIWKKARVVGVVRDFHFRSLHQEIEPMVMYIVPEWFSYLNVRIRPDQLSSTLDFMKRKWREFEPSRPFDTFFLDQDFNQFYRAERRFGETFAAFSLLAIFVACLGLFGLAAFTAEQRTKEIGVRKVLGASVSQIVVLLSREFGRLVLFALFLASPIAYYAVSKWLQGFAYRTEIGLATFLLVGLTVLAVAIFTVSSQAIKAALANPVESLRYE